MMTATLAMRVRIERNELRKPVLQGFLYRPNDRHHEKCKSKGREDGSSEVEGRHDENGSAKGEHRTNVATSLWSSIE